MVALRILAFATGAFVVQGVLRSAIRTVVVPRGEQARLTRYTFLSVRVLFEVLSRRKRTHAEREHTFARYGPISLMTLSAIWALGTIVGFVPIYWALGYHDLEESLRLSGSSLTTLGFVDPVGTVESLLVFVEAILGLGLVALLISYLPTIYQLFSRREAEVVKLDIRAGSPPTALEMLTRFARIGWLDRLDETWATWEQWFAELEESHTSHPALVHFRSQRPDSSWITGAGAVLDTAAIGISALDLPPAPQAAVTIRAGYMALRAIASYFAVPLDDVTAPNAPISIHRQEFDLLLDELAAQGIPVKADREQAWRAFAGWRVNYDVPLLALCALCDAPPTPWSSDRLERFHRPKPWRNRWLIDPPDTPPSW